MSGTMTRSLRAALALLVAALAGLVLAIGLAAPAHACRCQGAGLGQQAREADVVVAGTVLEVRESAALQQRRERAEQRGGQGRQDGQRGRPAVPGNLVLVVGVDRVYEGRVPGRTIEVVTANQASACGVGRLPVDQRYFFFLAEGDRSLRATSCGGTGPATQAQATAVTAALGEGRSLVPEEPTTVVQRTLVAGRDAPSVLLLTAPGLAVAALGLVGLAGLGVAARRR